MATKDTIEIDVNVGEGVKSLTNLKAEFKTLQKQLDGLDESSQEYIETLQKLGSVKDDIGDLSTAINDFAGTDAKIGAINSVVSGIASGFQAAQGAAALFGSESQDVEKALLKVQSVMALTEGIKGLTAMQDSLAAAGNVAKSLVTQLIGVDAYTKIVTVSTRIWNAVMAANPIMLVVAGITALVGVSALLAAALDKTNTKTEEYVELNKKQIAQNAELIKAIDNEITALSGLAANEGKIIELKKERLRVSLDTAKKEAQIAAAQLNEKQKELGILDEITASIGDLIGQEGIRKALANANSIDEQKALKEKLDLVKSLSAEQQAFENEQRQKKLDADKAAAEKSKQQRIQEANDLKEIQKRLADDFSNYQKELADKEAREKAERDKAENDAIEAEIQADFKKFEEDKSKRLEAQKKYEEDVKASDTAIKEAETKSIDALQGISAGFFAFKLRAAKGNASEELKIRKQQFAVDKAFNIARAIQDGIRSVQAALTIPPPGGQILAGVNAAIAAGNVAKLAASEFDGGSAGDIGSVNVSSPGTFTQAPNVGSGTSNNQTALNSDGSVNKTGQPSVLKAYVVESENAAVTKRVNKLTEQSKI